MVKVQSEREILVKQPGDSRVNKKFTFDRTFGPESKQSDVYQVIVAPLINEVLSGYNCTVFAYGQTGTGKTHTMIGDESPQNGSSYEDVSIVYSLFTYLFFHSFVMGGKQFKFKFYSVNSHPRWESYLEHCLICSMSYVRQNWNFR